MQNTDMSLRGGGEWRKKKKKGREESMNGGKKLLQSARVLTSPVVFSNWDIIA